MPCSLCAFVVDTRFFECWAAEFGGTLLAGAEPCTAEEIRARFANVNSSADFAWTAATADMDRVCSQSCRELVAITALATSNTTDAMAQRSRA